jgi:hypothetical protein
VDAVLALALAKKPSLRFDSADQFAAAWSDARSGRLGSELKTAASRLLVAHPWGTDYAAGERLTAT